MAVQVRAYTMRLDGVDKSDDSWRRHLWRTHETVNLGAEAFGHFLLTLRGGISHELATTQVQERRNERPPTADEVRSRRVLLSLSWLTAESGDKAPKAYIVAHEKIRGNRITWHTVDALRGILQKRGLTEAEAELWVSDCRTSLESAIRDDAVWVNRSQAFDDWADEQFRNGRGLAGTLEENRNLFREESWDLLGRFFDSREKYLSPKGDDESEAPMTTGAETDTVSEQSSDEDGAESPPPRGQARAKREKDLVKKAGGWLSERFGTGTPSDFKGITECYKAIDRWAKNARPARGEALISDLAKWLGVPEPESCGVDSVIRRFKTSGPPKGTEKILWRIAEAPMVSSEGLNILATKARQNANETKRKIGLKGHRGWADALLQAVEQACGLQYRSTPARHWQFSVMLDHAARRVSATHTWVKRAEAARRRFDQAASMLSVVPADAREWLDSYRDIRTEETGALEPYLIRRRALGGWEQVVRAWAKPSCRTAEDRRQAARDIQRTSIDNDKFGDINLFEALASDDALCVWQREGEPKPGILVNYAAATAADADQRRFKVPAYRHPDFLKHPVFCDFGDSRWNIWFGKNKPKKGASLSLPPENLLTMELVTGENTIEAVPLRWRSDRMRHDLGSSSVAEATPSAPVAVPRADRLGLVSAGATPGRPLAVKLVNKKWNGRLQAPRRHLREIADLLAKDMPDEIKQAKLQKLKKGMPWILSFSAQLEPVSSFVEKKLKGTAAYKNERRPTLGRIPGLRVLSVDLGHRHAAACAVWQTVTPDELQYKLDSARSAGADVQIHDLYAVVRHRPPATGETASGQTARPKTVIYRRIGPDVIPVDKTTGELKVKHPCPWARLERQFYINLQGEDESPRKPSPDELLKVERLCKGIGATPPSAHEKRTVSELMEFTVRTLRTALRRHGDCARIAHALLHHDGTSEDALQKLTRTLAIWYRLCSSDTRAGELWVELVSSTNATIPAPPGRTEYVSPKQRRDLEARLHPIAGVLIANTGLLQRFGAEWDKLWEQDDGQWPKYLREIRDWVLPRGRANRLSIRHVGGLSLTRISTIRMLYQVQKAYRMKPEPDSPEKNVPPPGDTSLDDFGGRMLADMEEMRENRVKQLASHIARAAFGIGKKGSQWYEPCHVIAIEYLEHYRPEQARTSRENRQLMTWSAHQLADRLKEECDLNGLWLTKVSAGYTSRQDSRTGAAGIRCSDVPLVDFLKSDRWRLRVERAREKNDAESRLLLELNEQWRDSMEVCRSAPPLLLPTPDGDIFVPSNPSSPSAGGLQADLNAAANIGLRALSDPEFTGTYWYVLTKLKKGVWMPDANKEQYKDVQLLKDVKFPIHKADRASDPVNLWRDISLRPLSEGEWEEFKPYWNRKRVEVVDILRRINGNRRHKFLGGQGAS